MSTHSIKRNDTARQIDDTLTRNGVPIDLTGATVNLIINTPTQILNRVATIVAPTNGTVRYVFILSDTAEAGEYLMEWRVTFPSGLILTVPDDGYIGLRVCRGL